jgi:5-hydroxyisourate hydrolase
MQHSCTSSITAQHAKLVREATTSYYAHPLACRLTDNLWLVVAESPTNADGRVPGLMQPGDLAEGTYRVTFNVEEYCKRTSQPLFYPQPCVDFVVTSEIKGQHFHIPLLVSPYAYSTYRGS